MTVTGLLLAAGGGSRMGRAKALVRDAEGTAWVVTRSRVLRAGGCAQVLVVLGAGYEEASASLAGEPVTILHNPGWPDGMGSSLRVGLGAAAAYDQHAIAVAVVDTPGLTAEVVRRITALAAPGVLARATYRGEVGHPVLIGADHVAGVVACAVGDSGARPYLQHHPYAEVECGDLGTGDDVDTPDQLPPGSTVDG